MSALVESGDGCAVGDAPTARGMNLLPGKDSLVYLDFDETRQIERVLNIPGWLDWLATACFYYQVVNCTYSCA